MQTVVVEFMDGEVRKIEHVSRTVIIESVLHVQKDRPFSGGYEHLGSFPLSNIRTYKIEG